MGLLLLGLWCAVPATTVRADLTVEGLTGNAISGVGPFYQDVFEAIRYFGNQDFTNALARLERAKEAVPKLAPAEVMMAQLYFDANQPGPGISVLEKGIQHWPDDPEAYVMLAERAVGEGRYVEAGLLFERASKAIEKFTENPKRKQNLAVRTNIGWATAEENSGRLNEAKTKLEALVKADPRSAAAQDRLARVLFAMEDQKGAYAAFKAAADIDKSLPTAEISMALLFKDVANAEKWVKAAASKYPDDARTQVGAARYYLRTNQLDEATAHAAAAIKLDPEGFDSNQIRGLIARITGDYKLAEAHLSKAHLLSPGNTLVINALALSLVECTDEASRQRALPFAELNMRLSPSSSEVIATLAWINYRLNRRLDADRAFSMMLKNSSGIKASAEIGYFLANFIKDRGRVNEAIRLLKDGIASNEPFAYRKQAKVLLAQLSKLAKTRAAKPEKSEKEKAEAAPATATQSEEVAK